jgi:hypothetical protein
MRATRECYSGLLNSIYEAALDASLWQSTLKTLVTTFGGNGGAIMSTARRSHNAVHATFGQDPAAAASYNAYYGRLDPVAAALERAPEGAVFGCCDIVPSGEQRRSEFFVDWAEPIDIGDGLFCSVADDGDHIAWLGIGALFRSAPFAGKRRKQLLKLLVPHLRQAMRVQKELSALDLQRHSAFAALDRLAHGVVLFDHGGSVLFANRAALRIAAAGQGLSISRAGISATVANEMRRRCNASSHWPTAGTVPFGRQVQWRLRLRLAAIG